MDDIRGDTPEQADTEQQIPPILPADGAHEQERAEYVATLGERKGGSRIAIIAAVIVLALAGGALAVVLRATEDGATLDTLVPGSVYAFGRATLAPTGEQARALEKLTARFPQQDGKALSDRVQDLLDTMFAEVGLSFRGDVKPWVGREIGFVVPSFDVRSGPAVVGLFAVRNEGAARAALEEARGKARQPFVFLVRAGAAYVAAEQRHIDEVVGGSPDASLARNEAYRKALARVGADSLAVVWVNGEKIGEVLQRAAGPIGGAGLPGGLGGANGTAVIALRAEENALSVTGFGEGDEEPKLKPGAPRLLESSPADVIGALTLFDLGGMIRQSLEALEGFLGPGASFDGDGFPPDVRGEANDMLRSLVGLDLESDILPWLHGEFSVLVGGFSQPPFPDVGVLIESTDDRAADRTIGALRRRLGDFGTRVGFEVQRLDDGFALTFEQGFGLIVRRTGSRVVVASSDVYAGTLLEASPASLADDAVYRTAVGGGGDDTTFQLFIRLDRIRGLIEPFVPGPQRAEYEQDVKPFLAPLQALGVRATQNGREASFRMLLTFAE